AVGSACQAQDALGVHIAVQRIDRNLAATAACPDDRHLALESNQLLVQQRDGAQLLPGACSLLRSADDRLSLAVVTHAARLEHAGEADLAQRPVELRAGVDSAPTCRRNPQLLE